MFSRNISRATFILNGGSLLDHKPNWTIVSVDHKAVSFSSNLKMSLYSWKPLLHLYSSSNALDLVRQKHPRHVTLWVRAAQMAWARESVGRGTGRLHVHVGAVETVAVLVDGRTLNVLLSGQRCPTRMTFTRWRGRSLFRALATLLTAVTTRTRGYGLGGLPNFVRGGRKRSPPASVHGNTAVSVSVAAHWFDRTRTLTIIRARHQSLSVRREQAADTLRVRCGRTSFRGGGFLTQSRCQQCRTIRLDLVRTVSSWRRTPRVLRLWLWLSVIVCHRGGALERSRAGAPFGRGAGWRWRHGVILSRVGGGCSVRSHDDIWRPRRVDSTVHPSHPVRAHHAGTVAKRRHPRELCRLRHRRTSRHVAHAHHRPARPWPVHLRVRWRFRVSFHLSETCRLLDNLLYSSRTFVVDARAADRLREVAQNCPRAFGQVTQIALLSSIANASVRFRRHISLKNVRKRDRKGTS